MDYEKAYKAVLQTATQWIKDGCTDKEKICLECVFPELRESEDERIRKGMIRFLESEQAEGIFTHEARLSWISYLEKQKEQKVDIDKLRRDIYQSGYNDGYQHGKEDAQKEQKPSEITPNQFDGITYGMKGYSSEKPAEKEITLTDFEKVLNTFLFDFANSTIEDCEPKDYIKKHSAEILKAAYKELNTQLQQDLFEAKQEGRREGYEVAKEELKPAEWSKEDERNKDRAIFYVRDYQKNNGATDGSKECVAWLKFFPKRFNLQPKQEWGEEDETMINHIIEALPKWANGLITILPSQAEEYVKRLKSLSAKIK